MKKTILLAALAAVVMATSGAANAVNVSKKVVVYDDAFGEDLRLQVRCWRTDTTKSGVKCEWRVKALKKHK